MVPHIGGVTQNTCLDQTVHCKKARSRTDELVNVSVSSDWNKVELPYTTFKQVFPQCRI